jgi:hypothetical protein
LFASLTLVVQVFDTAVNVWLVGLFVYFLLPTLKVHAQLKGKSKNKQTLAQQFFVLTTKNDSIVELGAQMGLNKDIANDNIGPLDIVNANEPPRQEYLTTMTEERQMKQMNASVEIRRISSPQSGRSSPDQSPGEISNNTTNENDHNEIDSPTGSLDFFTMLASDAKDYPPPITPPQRVSIAPLPSHPVQVSPRQQSYAYMQSFHSAHHSQSQYDETMEDVPADSTADRLKALVKRNLIGTFVLFTPILANVGIFWALSGNEPAWLCMTMCSIDLLGSVSVLHWLTSTTAETD